MLCEQDEYQLLDILLTSSINQKAWDSGKAIDSGWSKLRAFPGFSEDPAGCQAITE